MRVEVEFYRNEDAGVDCECHGSIPKAGVLRLLMQGGGLFAYFDICDNTLDILETQELHEENASKAR